MQALIDEATKLANEAAIEGLVRHQCQISQSSAPQTVEEDQSGNGRIVCRLWSSLRETIEVSSHLVLYPRPKKPKQSGAHTGLYNEYLSEGHNFKGRYT